MGFEPTVAWKKNGSHESGQAVGKVVVPEGECGPCPVFASYIILWYSFTREEKSGKSLRQGSQKVPAGHDSVSRHVDRPTCCLDWPAALHQPYFALQVTRVKLQPAQVPAELRN